VKTVHFEHSSLVGGVNSAKKFVNIYALKVLLALKAISNSDNSMDHLVILSAKSGWKRTCFSG
jgi:hypothetical protein